MPTYPYSVYNVIDCRRVVIHRNQIYTCILDLWNIPYNYSLKTMTFEKQ